jgi:aspartate racemase
LKRKTVGILGGMGPEATGDLFLKIVRATPARRDQDHLRIIVDSLPQVPDRTAAILGKAPDPSPALQAAARRLESWGAELIVIPCNTAHYYHGAIQGAVGVPVLDIMQETARAIRRDHPGVRNVGVLASTGTLNTGLYRNALAAEGLVEVVPSPEAQAAVMEAIYGVKAGQQGAPRQLLVAASAEMIASGAQAIVAGCTEVPIALSAEDISVPYVDATLALAQAAVRQATA